MTKYRNLTLIFAGLFLTNSHLRAANNTNTKEINDLKAEIRELNTRIDALSRQQEENKKIFDAFNKINIKGRAIFGTTLNEIRYVEGARKAHRNIDINKARLEFGYKISETIKFESAFQFTNHGEGNNIRLKTVSLTITPDTTSTLSLGVIYVVHTLNSEKSEIHSSVIEIPVIPMNLPNISLKYFDPEQAVGISYAKNFNNLVTHIGIFGNDVNDTPWSVSNRLYSALRSYYIFTDTDDITSHFGGHIGYIYNKIKNVKIDDAKINFKNKKYTVGAEFLFRYKNFGIESEYDNSRYKVKSKVVDFNTPENTDKTTFKRDDFFVEATYMLTGETKTYDKLEGCLKKVIVNRPVTEGGLGAFELASRYGLLDYHHGERMHTYSIGLNWLPADFSKILFTYSKVRIHQVEAKNRKGEQIALAYRFFF